MDEDHECREPATTPGVPGIQRCVSVPIILPNGSKAAALAISFLELADPREHIALAFDLEQCKRRSAPMVRIYSECLTGDVFGSARCDRGAQLREAVATMALQGGVILYLRQEGRGIGLYNKLETYHLQEQGLDTFAANRTLAFHDAKREGAGHRITLPAATPAPNGGSGTFR